MWKYYPELLATPVPRYTSYPTAAEFHDGVGEAEQQAGLNDIGADEEFSLYVHIPYCREICWYCGCNTGAANRSHRLVKYLDRLRQEIDLVAAALAGRGVVGRIAFGGGSPNAIAPTQFAALVCKIRSSFLVRSDAILSVEIDPRGFDKEFSAVLADAQVGRASLGVQTFDAGVQAAIGRVQSRQSIEDAVDLLRSAGVTSLNFDLMYGLPGQSEEILLDSIALSQSMGADRLAVFGYAHVPHLIPRQRRIDATALPDARARFGQSRVAYEALVGNHWVPVGFDHFAQAHDPLAAAAREGRARRNFQGFTDDPCDKLIGLGASAISRFSTCLVQNERNSGRYGMKVGTRHLAGARGIATPLLEKSRARIIERLLCQGSVELGDFPDRLSARSTLKRYEEAGLIEWVENRLLLRPDALPYARSVAASFDSARGNASVQLSTAI